MVSRKGILYGVGVGNGDAENITLKAVRIIKQCKYIAVPSDVKEDSTAYKIVEKVFETEKEALENKTWLEFSMPMTKDVKIWQQSHTLAAEEISKVLAGGEDVAFLCLGDPTIYSTYMYVHRLVEENGYEAEVISGIASFCAVAARAGKPLAEQKEQIHIIPANYGLEEALRLSGTKVFMKIGSRLSQLKEKLDENQEVFMVENCGMENEHYYVGRDKLPDKAGYFSIVVVKE
jgi:precorrin-2/cobalt-factor-2 C20-methyltransferase